MWAAFGRDRKTVEKFLDQLGDERCQQIRLVSCDDADWITRPISERCPDAVICLDPCHIVKAATDALDDVRRQVRNEARRSGNKQLATQLKGARFALWKRPENLTDRQQPKLAFIQQLNAPIYRAYLLKEQLRAIYHAATIDDALKLLDGWLKWARRSRLEPFVKLARRITEQHVRVEAALRHSLSNARVEQVNTDTPHHPPRLRLPLARSRDRPRDALTRRALPLTPRAVTQPTDASVGSVFGSDPRRPGRDRAARERVGVAGLGNGGCVEPLPGPQMMSLFMGCSRARTGSMTCACSSRNRPG